MQREPLNSLLWHAKRKSSEIVRDGFFGAGGCRQGIVMMGSAGHECNSPLTLIANASSPHAPRHLHHAARCWPGRSIASKLRRGGEGRRGVWQPELRTTHQISTFLRFSQGNPCLPRFCQILAGDSLWCWKATIFTETGWVLFACTMAPPSHYGPPWPAHSAAHHTAAASVFHAVTPFRAMTL